VDLRWDMALARHMQNGVGVFWLFDQGLNGIDRGKNHDVDLFTACFSLDLCHHGKRPVHSCSHYEALAFPGNFLFERDGSMSELVAKGSRPLFLAHTNLAPINHKIMLVLDAVDFERTELKFAEFHSDAPTAPIASFVSGMYGPSSHLKIQDSIEAPDLTVAHTQTRTQGRSSLHSAAPHELGLRTRGNEAQPGHRPSEDVPRLNRLLESISTVGSAQDLELPDTVQLDPQDQRILLAATTPRPAIC